MVRALLCCGLALGLALMGLMALRPGGPPAPPAPAAGPPGLPEPAARPPGLPEPAARPSGLPEPAARPPGLSEPAARPPAALGAAQPNAFYDAGLFFPGLQETGAEHRRGDGLLVGGLVPHHNLAGSMLSRFFIELEERPVQTVIVVGPNHEHRGQRIITGRRPWATDFGLVEPDLALVESLAGEGFAVVDDEALSTEHSVGALMPYLKYHAPGAKVVPLVLHKDVSRDEVRRLAARLAPLLGQERILVASVDFSHYLTRPEAERKDEETLQAIHGFELERLWRMGPDHLDSPPSLGLLMLTMQELQAAGPEIVGHTNSGVILGSDQIETTSYFAFKYRVRVPPS